MKNVLGYERPDFTSSYRRGRTALRFVPQDILLGNLFSQAGHFHGTHPLTILHVPTVAGSPTCSENVARILSYIHRAEPLQLILSDGAAGKLSPENLDPSWGEYEIQNLVDNGEVSGPELFLIRYDRSVPAYGCEDVDLYRANLQAQVRVRELLSQSADYVTHLNRLANQLGDKESKDAVRGERLLVSKPGLCASLFDRLLRLNLTVQQWLAIEPCLDDLVPGVFEQRLITEGIVKSGDVPVLNDDPQVQSLRDNAVEFYRLAVRRGTSHAKTIMRIASEHDATWIAACLTGFQEHSFREELMQQGVSILKVNPHLTVRRREPGNLFQLRYNRAVAANATRQASAATSLAEQVLAMLPNRDAPPPEAFDSTVAEEFIRRVRESEQKLAQGTVEGVVAALLELLQAERLCQAPDAPHEIAADVGLRLGQTWLLLQQTEAACQAVDATIRDPDEFAGAAHLIGAVDVYSRAHREERARELLERLPDCLDRVTDPQERLQFETHLMRLRESLEGIDGTVRANERLRQVAIEFDHEDTLAASENNLGLAHAILGDHVKGLSHLDRSVAIERDLAARHEGREYPLANALCNRARVLLLAGDDEAAATDLDEAETLAADRCGLKLARYRSRLAVQRGSHEEAVRFARQAAELSVAAVPNLLADEDDQAWLSSLEEEQP